MADHAEEEAPSASPIQKLREKAARADALERELSDLRRDVALDSLKLTDVQRDALLAVHKGEPTAEAYKATAESLSFIEPPQWPLEEQLAYEKMEAFLTGAEPSEAQLETIEQRVNAADSPDAVRQILASNNLLSPIE